MIDPNLLRCNLELIATKLFRRQCVLDIDLLRDQEVKRKCLQVRMQSLRSRSNLISKDIGVFKSRGDNVDSLFQEVNNLSKELQLTENDFKKLHNDITNYLLTLPNIPDDNIPDGCNSKDNLELLRWGTPRVYDFAIKDHVELGKVIGGLDFSIAAQITGSRFVVMKGVIAKLHRALSQFMLDLHIQEHGYQEYYVPYLVNKRALYGTGQLPKFVEDLFYVNFSNKENCSYALIPTAEVPLTNLVRNNILDEDVLPLKMTSCTPCFRSEVGNYGRDTRGLIRMHQFDKIEMVQIVKPEESMHILEEMTGHAEKVLQLLKLPYRKVLLCAGDLSFSACKTYDLEVWLPARNMYCEVSSCSNIGDFQSRRMYARYRSKKGNKIRFLHTINGSGLAVGRTLMAVLENYQLSNGQIEIPLVLQTYMNGVTSTGEE